MKKILLFGLLLLGGFALLACDLETTRPPGLTDQEKVEDAAGRIPVLFPNRGEVTGNLTFPTTMIHDVQVAWSSDNVDVISNSGAVTRPEPGEALVVVTVTATFTLNEATTVRDIVFTVVPLPESDELTLAEAMLAPANQIITVRGIVTTLYGGNNRASIQDETGAFFLFGIGSYTDVQIGDEVLVTGRRTTFNGLAQVTDIASLEIVSPGNDLPEPVLFDFDLEDKLIYQSKLATVEGLFLKTTPNITGTGGVNFMLVDNDGEDVIAFRVESVANLGEAVRNPIVEYMNGLQAGDQLNLVGALVGWYNTPQFLITDVAQLVKVELTDEEKVEVASNVLTLGDTSMVLADLNLPSEGSQGTTITWESQNLDALLNDGTVIRGAEDVTVTLVATITLDSFSATKEFTIVVKSENFNPMSVADALLEADGTLVVIEAVVSSIFENRFGIQAYFLQDADGTSILINSDLATWEGDIEVGNKVIVQGTLQTYSSFGNGQRRLSSADAAMVTNDEGNHPVLIIDDQTMNDIVTVYPASSSVRYHVENVVVEEFDAFNAIMFVTGEAMRIKFDVRDYVTYFKDVYQVGDTIPWIEFTVYDINFNDMRVVDVVMPELTNAQIEAYIGNNIDVPEEASSNLTLPASVTLAGVEYPLTWESSNEAVIAADGTVVRPALGEADAVVTLTATVTLDGQPVTFNYTVTVLALSEQGEATTVTASYTGGTTNMATYPDNNASLIDLDETLFTVQSVKNQASPEVGLNTAGQIRIYAHRQSGEGNTLVVSIGAGYTITGVEFVFGASTNNPTGTLLLGSASYSLVNEDLRNTTLSYSDLSISTFSLQNTDAEGTSNAQIYILEIIITYVQD